MAAYIRFAQAPDALLDYTVDWSSELQTDTINTSTWVCDSGLTISNESVPDTQHTIVWCSGGTLGQSYNVTNTITSNGGRTEDKTFTVVVVQT
jgi:hypothetical protein